MIDNKVALLGFLISVAFTLNAVGIFTPTWVMLNSSYYSVIYFLGIIPFHAGSSGWLAVGRSLMLTSFAMFISMSIFYFLIFMKTNVNGYSPFYRRWFYAISVCAAIILILTPTAVTLIGVNGNYGLLTLGYSVWLYVASTVLTIGVLSLSGYIGYKECREEDDNEKNDVL